MQLATRQGGTVPGPGTRPGPPPGYVPGESGAGEEDPGASLDTPPDEPESVPAAPDVTPLAHGPAGTPGR